MSKNKQIILLSAEKIQALFPLLNTPISIFPTLDSTNNYLINQVKNDNLARQICLAEEQTAARGQRGKIWCAPASSNIYCSILWQFAMPSNALASLSLIAGLAVVKTLAHFGIPEIGLKWPNDVWQANQKIAGILVEIAQSNSISSSVVIGIGLNVNAPQIPYAIDQPWTCMQYAAGKAFDRNEVCAILLNNLFTLLESFALLQREALLAEWKHWDILCDQAISIKVDNKIYHGIAKSIDEQGCLLVSIDGKQQTFRAGEVSVRLLESWNHSSKYVIVPPC